MTDEMTTLQTLVPDALRPIAHARPSAISTPAAGNPPALGDRQTCAVCGVVQTYAETTNTRGPKLRHWTECQCLIDACDAHQNAVQQATARAAAHARAQLAQALGLDRVAGFTLDQFDDSRYGGTSPATAALIWLQRIARLPHGAYHDDLPVCLHFYSDGKGRGKTHLAAGLALRLRQRGMLAAFVEESSYLTRYWASDFTERAAMQQLLGDQAWLTVIDDIGQNPPPVTKREQNGTMAAWYDVINRRWTGARWTILTSNRTLDELAEQGTINDATYSRLYQMTSGNVLRFESDDYRLGGAA